MLLLLWLSRQQHRRMRSRRLRLTQNRSIIASMRGVTITRERRIGAVGMLQHIVGCNSERREEEAVPAGAAAEQQPEPRRSSRCSHGSARRGGCAEEDATRGSAHPASASL